jgi:hypothetical protein
MGVGWSVSQKPSKGWAKWTYPAPGETATHTFHTFHRNSQKEKVAKRKRTAATAFLLESAQACAIRANSAVSLPYINLTPVPTATYAIRFVGAGGVLKSRLNSDRNRPISPSGFLWRFEFQQPALAAQKRRMLGQKRCTWGISPPTDYVLHQTRRPIVHRLRNRVSAFGVSIPQDSRMQAELCQRRVSAIPGHMMGHEGINELERLPTT